MVFEKSIRADFQKHIYAQTYMKTVILIPDKVSQTLHGIYTNIISQIDALSGLYDGSISPHCLKPPPGDKESS